MATIIPPCVSYVSMLQWFFGPCRRFSLTALCHQLVQSRPQKYSTGVGSVLSMKWDQIRYRMISSQHIEYHWIISESYLNRIELYWIWIHRFHSESHDRWWINSVARRWSTSVPFVRRKLPRSVAWSLAQVYPGVSRGCAQRGVNINSIRVKTCRDMSTEITWYKISEICKLNQTDISSSTRRYLEYVACPRPLPKSLVLLKVASGR